MSPALDPTIRDLNDCGCCAGAGTLTPVQVLNRPGLSAIVYRTGTHAQFRRSMLASLSDARRTPLRAFNTRDDDDFSIALLDAWAMVADVLAFYQERIANESYLRTATERRSVLELARIIGYELAPGVAASTWLAFTIEESNGASRAVTGMPSSVMVPAGTRGQSIPGQGEIPQTFETSEPIEARAGWNALKPRATRPASFSTGDTVIYLNGGATGLRQGDALLIVGDERFNDPASRRWGFRMIRNVAVIGADDPAASYTAVTLDHGLGSLSANVPPAAVNPRVYALRQRAALFGASAPEWRAMPRSLKEEYLGIPEGGAIPYDEWPGFTLADLSDPPVDTLSAGAAHGLYGEYFGTTDFRELRTSRIDPVINFQWGTGTPAPGVSADSFSVRWTGWVVPSVSGVHTFYVTGDDGVRLRVNGALLVDHWQVQGATERSGRIQLVAGTHYDITLEYYENTGAATAELRWSAPGIAKEIIPSSRFIPRVVHTVHLDSFQPRIFAGGWAVLATPENQELYGVDGAAESSRTGFTLNAKTTRLRLAGEQLFEKFNRRLRDTAVYAASEELVIHDIPMEDPVQGDVIELEGAVEGLSRGRFLAFTGADRVSGEIVSEVGTIREIATIGGVVTVTLERALAHAYRRAGLVINANVAPATHGETKTEVLGSGDASRPFQRFTLRQKPLTYVSADNPSGGTPALEIRVDGVLWENVPTLHDRGPRERIYIIRNDAAGGTTVIFGDGRTGARIPTGVENVTARYRVGIGREGEVDAEQIALLMTRPLGVRGVINPVAATGAADPQDVADSRENAPRSVLTLGRIVSLRDFEDFARNFAGIGKALATWTWNHNGRGVLLTVAGVGGDVVPEGSRLYESLLAAIAKAGDRHVPVQVKSYRPATFIIRGSVVADPAYPAGKVAKEIDASLRSRFSFEARSFGQPVHSGEVIAAIQSVPGVLFVDLDEILRAGPGDAMTPLEADFPRPGAPATVLPAELLMLDPAPLDGLEVKQWASI